MTNNVTITVRTTHMYRYFTFYLYFNHIENSIDTRGYQAFPLSLGIGNGSCCHCQQSVTCSVDWVGKKERERIPLGIVWEVSHWKYCHYMLKRAHILEYAVYCFDQYTNLCAKTVPSSWMWPHRHPPWWSVLESSRLMHGDQCSTNTEQT